MTGAAAAARVARAARIQVDPFQAQLFRPRGRRQGVKVVGGGVVARLTAAARLVDGALALRAASALEAALALEAVADADDGDEGEEEGRDQNDEAEDEEEDVVALDEECGGLDVGAFAHRLVLGRFLRE